MKNTNKVVPQQIYQN